MYCIKCGKETENEKMFCGHCLEVMEKYPVKQNTPVQLPKRPQQIEQKKSRRRRRALDPEEQIPQLRSTVRALLLCLIVVSILLGVLSWFHFSPIVEDFLNTESTTEPSTTVEPTTEEPDTENVIDLGDLHPEIYDDGLFEQEMREIVNRSWDDEDE